MLGFADLARASTGVRTQAEAAALVGLLPATEQERRAAQDAARSAVRRAWRARRRAAQAGRPAWALRLTLGGAPPSWHVVDGLRGAFHPARLAGVGQPGEPTLRQARAADADPGCAVELVAVSAEDALAELARLDAGEPVPAELAAPHLAAIVRARSPQLVDGAERQVRRDAARARERLDEHLL